MNEHHPHPGPDGRRDHGPQYGNQGSAPAPQQWQQPRRKNWFLRHKVLTTFLVLLVLLVIAVAAGGGKKAADSKAAPGASSSGSGTKSSSSSGPGSVAALAQVGTPVRDGKFEFTITQVERGKTSVGPQYGEENAQGEFTLVHVTVKNIGDAQQSLSDSDQKAMDTDGTQYSADSAADVSVPGNNVIFNQINPGNQVKGVLVFDAPKGKRLTKIELHDSFLSNGVNAAL